MFGLLDGEFDCVTVEAVDVGARGIALKVETILFAAARDDLVVNHLAVDRIDGEGGIEGQIGGNHDVVGSRIGVAGSRGEGGVVVDAGVVGVDFVYHAVAFGELVSTRYFDGSGGCKRVESVGIATPSPTDIELLGVA